ECPWRRECVHCLWPGPSHRFKIFAGITQLALSARRSSASARAVDRFSAAFPPYREMLDLMSAITEGSERETPLYYSPRSCNWNYLIDHFLGVSPTRSVS